MKQTLKFYDLCGWLAVFVQQLSDIAQNFCLCTSCITMPLLYQHVFWTLFQVIAKSELTLLMKNVVL